MNFAISIAVSIGAGKKSFIASNNFLTLAAIIAEPQSTGVISRLAIPFLRAVLISSSVNSSPAKYLSIKTSSVSAIDSKIICLAGSATSSISSGTGISMILPSSNFLASILITLT